MLSNDPAHRMAKLGAQGHSVSWFCDFPLWLHDAVSLSLPGGVS